MTRRRGNTERRDGENVDTTPLLDFAAPPVTPLKKTGDDDVKDRNAADQRNENDPKSRKERIPDIAEYQAQAEARKREHRKLRQQRLKRNMIFKCATFLIMVIIALCVKWVQEFWKKWQGK